MLSPFSDQKAFLDTKQVQEEVNKFISLGSANANFKLSDVIVARRGDKWVANAKFKSETMFARIFGKHYIDGEVETSVSIGSKQLEIVFVLDTSGSMLGDRMTALKAAVKKIIGSLNSYQANNIKMKVALVPFSSNVNVEIYMKMPLGWM